MAVTIQSNGVFMSIGDTYPVAAPTVKIVGFVNDDAGNPAVAYVAYTAPVAPAAATVTATATETTTVAPAVQAPPVAANTPANAAMQAAVVRLGIIPFIQQFLP